MRGCGSPPPTRSEADDVSNHPSGTSRPRSRASKVRGRGRRKGTNLRPLISADGRGLGVLGVGEDKSSNLWTTSTLEFDTGLSKAQSCPQLPENEERSQYEPPTNWVNNNINYPSASGSGSAGTHVKAKESRMTTTSRSSFRGGSDKHGDSIQKEKPRIRTLKLSGRSWPRIDKEFKKPRVRREKSPPASPSPKSRERSRESRIEEEDDFFCAHAFGSMGAQTSSSWRSRSPSPPPPSSRQQADRTRSPPANRSQSPPLAQSESRYTQRTRSPSPGGGSLARSGQNFHTMSGGLFEPVERGSPRIFEDSTGFEQSTHNKRFSRAVRGELHFRSSSHSSLRYKLMSDAFGCDWGLERLSTAEVNRRDRLKPLKQQQSFSHKLQEEKKILTRGKKREYPNERPVTAILEAIYPTGKPLHREAPKHIKALMSPWKNKSFFKIETFSMYSDMTSNVTGMRSEMSCTLPNIYSTLLTKFGGLHAAFNTYQPQQNLDARRREKDDSMDAYLEIPKKGQPGQGRIEETRNLRIWCIRLEALTNVASEELYPVLKVLPEFSGSRAYEYTQLELSAIIESYGAPLTTLYDFRRRMVRLFGSTLACLRAMMTEVFNERLGVINTPSNNDDTMASAWYFRLRKQEFQIVLEKIVQLSLDESRKCWSMLAPIVKNPTLAELAVILQAVSPIMRIEDAFTYSLGTFRSRGDRGWGEQDIKASHASISGQTTITDTQLVSCLKSHSSGIFDRESVAQESGKLSSEDKKIAEWNSTAIEYLKNFGTTKSKSSGATSIYDIKQSIRSAVSLPFLEAFRAFLGRHGGGCETLRQLFKKKEDELRAETGASAEVLKITREDAAELLQTVNIPTAFTLRFLNLLDIEGGEKDRKMSLHSLERNIGIHAPQGELFRFYDVINARYGNISDALLGCELLVGMDPRTRIDYKLTKDELYKGLISIYPEIDDFWLLWVLFDANGNGYVTLREIALLWDALILSESQQRETRRKGMQKQMERQMEQSFVPIHKIVHETKKMLRDPSYEKLPPKEFVKPKAVRPKGYNDGTIPRTAPGYQGASQEELNTSATEARFKAKSVIDSVKWCSKAGLRQIFDERWPYVHNFIGSE